MGAAGERELVDQRSVLIPADDVKFVAASASGAHEVQPEAVDVGLDLVQSGERDVAADALEHGAGVRPEGDGQATANHVAHDLKMVASRPDHSEHSLDMVAVLTPPEGYVLVPVELPVEMEIAFMEAWVSKRRCFDDPEMQDAWAAALAARPEVPS